VSRPVTRLSDRRDKPLDSFSTDALVTAVIMLTHRVAGTDDEKAKAECRAQRDAAKREILRRAGP
jgi:hypothetical protein